MLTGADKSRRSAYSSTLVREKNKRNYFICKHCKQCKHSSFFLKPRQRTVFRRKRESSLNPPLHITPLTNWCLQCLQLRKQPPPNHIPVNTPCLHRVTHAVDTARSHSFVALKTAHGTGKSPGRLILLRRPLTGVSATQEELLYNGNHDPETAVSVPEDRHDVRGTHRS